MDRGTQLFEKSHYCRSGTNAHPKVAEAFEKAQLTGARTGPLPIDDEGWPNYRPRQPRRTGRAIARLMPAE